MREAGGADGLQRTERTVHVGRAEQMAQKWAMKSRRRAGTSSATGKRTAPQRRTAATVAQKEAAAAAQEAATGSDGGRTGGWRPADGRRETSTYGADGADGSRAMGADVGRATGGWIHGKT